MAAGGKLSGSAVAVVVASWRRCAVALLLWAAIFEKGIKARERTFVIIEARLSGASVSI